MTDTENEKSIGLRGFGVVQAVPLRAQISRTRSS